MDEGKQMVREQMKAGDFFRCFDGPNRYQFGKCIRHDDEWLTVEFFRGWVDYRSARHLRRTYPLSISRGLADRFLEYAEVWP
jgi:hypothetical protein